MKSRESNNGKPRLWALVGTIALHGAVLLALLLICLSYTPGEELSRTWPPVDDDEILYGGEYVMVGDDPAAETADNNPAPEEQTEPPAVEGTAIDNGGEAAEAPAVVASREPSPVKVKEKPVTKPGPTKEELERAERERQERETAERVSRRVKFGGSGTGTDGSAKAGSPTGNAATGALSGAPGTDLKGRTLASWSKPTGRATGTIIVQVTVNRKGRVVSARYVSGSGPIATDQAARRSCEQAALKSAFSVDDNASVAQVGRITYRFE